MAFPAELVYNFKSLNEPNTEKIFIQSAIEKKMLEIFFSNDIEGLFNALKEEPRAFNSHGDWAEQ